MFGITLAGSHMKFEQQTDNSEPRYDATGLNNLRNAKYIIEREINSLSGKLEFYPADGHRITATSLYTEFLDHEQRNQYNFRSEERRVRKEWVSKCISRWLTDN